MELFPFLKDIIHFLVSSSVTKPIGLIELRSRNRSVKMFTSSITIHLKSLSKLKLIHRGHVYLPEKP